MHKHKFPPPPLQNETQRVSSQQSLEERLQKAEQLIEQLRFELQAQQEQQIPQEPDEPQIDFAAETGFANVSAESFEDQYSPIIPPAEVFNGQNGQMTQAAQNSDQLQTLSQEFAGTQRQFNQRLGINLFQTDPDFSEGIVIWGPNAAMKIGGYVKADLIQDFDPIDSDTLFDPGTIPVGAPPRMNSTFHARSSRMNFDTRWPTNPDYGIARAFVEVDFFSEGDGFRLRHAYGELRRFLIGQTWSTFTDVNSLPTTLDFEGSASVIQRRQAQVRWTQPIYKEGLTLAIALEDPTVIIEVPMGVMGETRSESPDLVSHLRYSGDWADLQVATVVRSLGFQPVGKKVLTKTAWGLNFSGSLNVSESDSVVFQIHFGEGIGSYRGLPDAAPTSATSEDLLGVFGWMIGWTHLWRENLQSNFTFSEATIDNLPGQDADSLHRKVYLATNLIWQPTTRVFIGGEYLFGIRENFDGQDGEAHRVQASFGFYLP